MIYYIYKSTYRKKSVAALCITFNIKGWMVRPFTLRCDEKLGGLQSLCPQMASGKRQSLLKKWVQG